MLKTTALYVFLISCISSTVLADFKIAMPIGLKEWWDRNPQSTHTSIAAFGEIPWGRKIMGRIGLASPQNACSFIQLKEDAEHVPAILIAYRGDCPFYLKAHYAQLAGAKLLLIVDNQYEEVETKLMVDSAGQGESIHIASALLARQGGEKIIEALSNSDPSVHKIIGSFDFALARKDDVSYNLWLTSSSAQTFRFLREWKQYENKLSQIAKMEPHYGHFSTNDVGNQNCICGGRYCATDPDGDLPNTGADVVQEDLRQLCVKQEYGIVAWWDYVLMYHESCLQGQNLLECSKDIMRKLHVDSKVIEECWKYSLSPDPSTTTCKKSTLLDVEEEVMHKDGAFLFPTVIINGFTYRGNLVPARGVFETICETFNSMPDVCQAHFDEPPAAATTVSTNHVPTVIAAIAFLIIFSLFVFCCYKRYLMREMYKQGVREVNMAVSQYIAFKDSETDRDETD